MNVHGICPHSPHPVFVEAESIKSTPYMSFSSLGLSEQLVRATADQGYETPSPIQLQAIPAVLSGKDVMAAAQTGTGKTAGFTLPLLQRLAENPRTGKGPRALILTFTRELAAQVHDSVNLYSKYVPTKAAVVFGGVKINPQMMKLRKGLDVLVATPGRLMDLTSRTLCASTKWKSWYWTKLTACWIWALSATSARSLRCCRPSARTCCSLPPSPTRSAPWPRACWITRYRWKWRPVTPPPRR